MKKVNQTTLTHFQKRPLIIVSRTLQQKLKGGDDEGIGILDEVEG